MALVVVDCWRGGRTIEVKKEIRPGCMEHLLLNLLAWQETGKFCGGYLNFRNLLGCCGYLVNF